MKIIPNHIFFGEVEKILASGQQATLTVKGRSMSPFLRNGKDAVMLSAVSAADLQRGHIVLFRYEGRHLLHRIVRVSGENLMIQGDGAYRTEYATRADVAGLVVQVVRPNGKKEDPYKFPFSLYWRLWVASRPVRRLLLPAVQRIYQLKVKKLQFIVHNL